MAGRQAGARPFSNCLPMRRSGHGFMRALYSMDWAAAALLLVLFFFGSQAGPPRDGRPREESPVPGGPAQRRGEVTLLPRRSGLYRASLTGRLIVIDPGHGGPDSGTQGQASVPEKAVVLDVALQLASILEQAGSRVELTRRGDYLPAPGSRGLSARVDLARVPGTDVFISLHADAHADPSVRGVTTYYYRADSLPLARAIHEELVDRLGAPDRGIRRTEFYVIQAAPVPAVLVELGYMTHPQEAALLSRADYRRRAAAAIAEGLARYFASLERAGLRGPAGGR